MDTLDIITRLTSDLLRIPPEPLLQATTLKDAGIDSLATLDIVFAIESRFGISVAPEDLNLVRSLKDLAAVVDRVVTRKVHSHDD